MMSTPGPDVEMSGLLELARNGLPGIAAERLDSAVRAAVSGDRMTWIADGDRGGVAAIVPASTALAALVRAEEDEYPAEAGGRIVRIVIALSLPPGIEPYSDAEGGLIEAAQDGAEAAAQSSGLPYAMQVQR